MSNDGVNQGRRTFLTAATSVVGAAGAVGVAVPFVKSWNPSAKAKAAGAPVKVSIAKLEPGAILTVEWRGKPVFIVRRTPEALANLRKMDERVADPHSENADSKQPAYAKNDNRAIRDEFVVLLGLCTHLGCSPMFRPEIGPMDFDPEWLGGFFCPCHGSKFDLAGRVYQGVPAPANLEVPPHRYESDFVLVIGEDEVAA